ncbi:FAD-binding oxidoreductase [Nocardia sp. NPDC052566]|uniref:FAD-binding oxidoreductase n=1 Tax=Nocardia sp. NPDC052566 TaxID=3364330 RepID=UPI0037C517D8
MEDIEGLRSAVRGRVSLPGDDDFEQSGLPWNSAVAQDVRAVVRVADAEDAAALVRYARAIGVPLSVQPNGHGASGSAAGTILVRTGALDEVRIDPVRRAARVGAGVAWDRVQAAASEFGLTGLAGSSAVVNVVGYTLGGGLSWFGRAYGWAADSVTAFEIVDADGMAARVTAYTDPDLFWALRGGGGDFALVTAVEFALHLAPSVYGGRMLWPARQAARVLAEFGAITAAAPRTLTVWANLLAFPGADPMVSVDVTYLGDAAVGARFLAPLDDIGDRISDTRRPILLPQLGSIAAEPISPSPNQQHAELLTGLDEAACAALLSAPPGPVTAINIRHLGGALTHRSDSPIGILTEPYLINFLGFPTTPGAPTAIRARTGQYLDRLAPRLSGRVPFNFLTRGESAARAFDHDTLTRLRRIKSDRDPDGVFHSNFPVREEDRSWTARSGASA